jgi:hypothetical protein
VDMAGKYRPGAAPTPRCTPHGPSLASTMGPVRDGDIPASERAEAALPTLWSNARSMPMALSEAHFDRLSPRSGATTAAGSAPLILPWPASHPSPSLPSTGHLRLGARPCNSSSSGNAGGTTRHPARDFGGDDARTATTGCRVPGEADRMAYKAAEAIIKEREKHLSTG